MEIDKNKAKAVLAAKPPSNKKELQRLLDKSIMLEGSWPIF